MNDHVHILWKFSAYEIQRFTGSDIAGILHTGNMIQFQSGLILKETLLGWTLSWKTDKVEISGITYCVMPLQVNDAKFPIYDILVILLEFSTQKKRIAEKKLRWQPNHILIEVFNVMFRKDLKWTALDTRSSSVMLW